MRGTRQIGKVTTCFFIINKINAMDFNYQLYHQYFL